MCGSALRTRAPAACALRYDGVYPHSGFRRSHVRREDYLPLLRNAARRKRPEMFQVAKIHFGAGALLLPANDPYDRELVFEQADFYARRYGAVDMEVGHAQMRAARSTGEPGLACARCRERLRSVSFEVGERRFCTQCAKDVARSLRELLRALH